MSFDEKLHVLEVFGPIGKEWTEWSSHKRIKRQPQVINPLKRGDEEKLKFLNAISTIVSGKVMLQVRYITPQQERRY
jgi:hypothetical protein